MSKEQWMKENLKDNEHYAGIMLGKGGEPDHHLILLPGETESVNFEGAEKFAVKAGGELPTRREQSLLFANLKEQFKPNWYWSGEQHAAYSDYAWYQKFIRRRPGLQLQERRAPCPRSPQINYSII